MRNPFKRWYFSYLVPIPISVSSYFFYPSFSDTLGTFADAAVKENNKNKAKKKYNEIRKKHRKIAQDFPDH